MKKIIFMLILSGLFSQVAHADILVRLKDGTASVWKSYYQKASSYCTIKEIGEICWEKTDVASIKEVPAGTRASEYDLSVAEGADPEVVGQRRDENTAALKSLNCAQLKAANTKAAKAQYRNECYTPEEKAAWNEKSEAQRKERNRNFKDMQREQKDYERERKERDREWKDREREQKDRERDSKIDRIDRTLRGW